eukprot:TRINITY_DN1667_c0_g1_i5.p1 TRINITY_DN1667_c0_g1~~TRINITY_DN1667_c0_g1_i5.p1  ORF type:complete len:483 (+),score=138.50 TRINITY_DN1667_c0_g1_i5:459-1907(+)
MSSTENLIKPRTETGVDFSAQRKSVNIFLEQENISRIKKCIDMLRTEAKASASDFKGGQEVVKIVKELQERMAKLTDPRHRAFLSATQKFMTDLVKVIKAKNSGQVVEENNQSFVKESQAVFDKTLGDTIKKKVIVDRRSRVMSKSDFPPPPPIAVEPERPQPTIQTPTTSIPDKSATKSSEHLDVTNGADRRASRRISRAYQVDQSRERLLLEQIEALQRENTDLQAKIAVQSEEVQNSLVTKAHQAQEYTRLKRISVVLKETSDESRAELAKVRAELATLQTSFNTIKAEREAWNSKESQLKEQLLKYQKIALEWETKYNNESKSFHEKNKIETTTQAGELQKLRETVKTLQEQNASLNAEKISLSEESKDAKSKLETYKKAAQAKIVQLEQAVGDLYASNQGLIDDKNTLVKQHQQISRELDTKDKLIESLNIEKQLLTKKTDELVEQLSEVCETTSRNDNLLNEHVDELGNYHVNMQP